MRIWLILLMIVLPACGSPQESGGQSESRYMAITGGQIIDGTGAAPRADIDLILVKDNKIEAIGARADIEIPTGTRIIDASGKTVMPGLIDVHVHFDILGHADYDHWFNTYPGRMYDDIFPAAAKAMLHAGVTSVRDLGGNTDNIFRLKDDINAGRIQGPRPFIAGPFLRKSVTGYVPKTYKDTWVIDGAEDAREKVRLLKSMGVDVIKTQDEGLTHEELTAIFDEAEALGLRTASHIYSPEGVRAALKAGMRNYATIEHIGDGKDPAYDQDIVDMIIAQDVVMAPTIIALEGVHKIVRDPSLLDDPRWAQFIPADIMADIRASYTETDLAAHPIFIRNDEDAGPRDQKLRQLSEAGAIFAISSDSGTRGNPHHNAMWREMELTKSVTGKTNLEIIRMATQVNALVLDQADRLGTLEPGKLADIIIIDGDPMKDFSALANVVHVIKDGDLIK